MKISVAFCRCYGDAFHLSTLSASNEQILLHFHSPQVPSAFCNSFQLTILFAVQLIIHHTFVMPSDPLIFLVLSPDQDARICHLKSVYLPIYKIELKTAAQQPTPSNSTLFEPFPPFSYKISRFHQLCSPPIWLHHIHVSTMKLFRLVYLFQLTANNKSNPYWTL